MTDEHFQKYEQLDAFGKGKMKAFLELDNYCQKEVKIIKRAMDDLNKDTRTADYHMASMRSQLRTLNKVQERIKVKLNNLKTI